MHERRILVASFLAAMVFLLATNAEAAMTKDQAAAHVAKEFGVKVLDIRPDNADGKAVFVVKIMFLGGNFNTAFQVNTWVVDAEDGKRVSQFQHLPSGQTFSGGHDSHPNRQPTDALRGHVWR
jgi:hypothetical protein